MKIALILAAALLASTAHASAGYSGNDLLAEIEGGPASNMRAMRYIDGVVDGDLMGSIVGGGPLSICMPAGSTLGQARDTVHAYLTANPTGRHRAAASIVHTVLSMSYPCAAQRKQRGSSL